MRRIAHFTAYHECPCAQDVFYANMRKYHTSMEYALDNYRIPVTVYEKLIEAVHEHMDTMHHYVGLRKKLLDAKELHMYDMYVPVVKKPEKNLYL